MLGVCLGNQLIARALQRWFVGHSGEIAAARGISLAGPCADTARSIETVTARVRVGFEEWLSAANL